MTDKKTRTVKPSTLMGNAIEAITALDQRHFAELKKRLEKPTEPFDEAALRRAIKAYGKLGEHAGHVRAAVGLAPLAGVAGE